MRSWFVLMVLIASVWCNDRSPNHRDARDTEVLESIRSPYGTENDKNASDEFNIPSTRRKLVRKKRGFGALLSLGASGFTVLNGIKSLFGGGSSRSSEGAARATREAYAERAYLRRRIDSLRERCAIANSGLNRLTNSFQALLSRQENQGETLRRFGEIIDHTKAALGRVDVKLGGMQATLKQHGDKFDDIGGILENHGEQFRGIQTTLNQHGKKFDLIQKTIDDFIKPLNEINQKLEAHSENFQRMEKTLEKHGIKFDNIKEILVAHGKNFYRIEKTLESHGIKFDHMKKILVAHGENFYRIEKTLESHGMKFDDIKTILLAHGEHFYRIETMLESHGKHFERIENTLDGIYGKLDDIGSLLIENGRKFDKVVDILKRSDRRLREMSQKLDRLIDISIAIKDTIILTSMKKDFDHLFRARQWLRQQKLVNGIYKPNVLFQYITENRLAELHEALTNINSYLTEKRPILGNQNLVEWLLNGPCEQSLYQYAQLIAMQGAAYEWWKIVTVALCQKKEVSKRKPIGWCHAKSLELISEIEEQWNRTQKQQQRTMNELLMKYMYSKNDLKSTCIVLMGALIDKKTTNDTFKVVKGYFDWIKKDGRTPLHGAAWMGSLHIVKYMVMNTNVNLTDKFGFTPLYYAAGNGHFNVAQFLFSRGAVIKSEVKRKEVRLGNEYGLSYIGRGHSRSRLSVKKLRGRISAESCLRRCNEVKHRYNGVWYQIKTKTCVCVEADRGHVAVRGILHYRWN